MPTLSFKFGDEEYARLIAAVCKSEGYQEVIDEKPNPESREDFARRMIMWAMQRTVYEHELDAARSAVPPPPKLDITPEKSAASIAAEVIP